MIRMVSSYLRRFYISFATNILDVPPRLLAFLLFLLLLCIPATKPTGYLLTVLILANMNALFAASWDILVGRSGQISLGHALFFGIGAYSTAFFSHYFNLPIWATLLLSVPFGVLAALLVGFPCLRVKGPYLALVTLAFPLILVSLFFVDIPGVINLKKIMGGEFGITGVSSFLPIPPYTPYQRGIVEFYISLFLLAVCTVALYKIARSKTGIIFVSILDDELASKASGINTTKYKLMAFTISAFFASLVGGFYAHFIGSASTSTFLFGSPTSPGSFMVIIMTIFGGIGTIYGPVVGAYILTLLPMFLRDIIELVGELANLKLPIEQWTTLTYIIIALVFIVVWSRGIATSIVEKLDELTEIEEIRKDKKKGKKRR